METARQLSFSNIIDIHSLLIRDLGISKSIRNRLVRITRTFYTPLENEFLIQQAIEDLCILVNQKQNVYEKALLTILMLSYIQPFEDGNKRTARFAGNSLLIASNACPLSYRTVSIVDYKKATLLFYELNNVNAFKKLFLNQYEYAVKNYY